MIVEAEFDPDIDFKSETPADLDPDTYSPTLRRYHQLLWAKPLRSGRMFTLEAPARVSAGYLFHPTQAEAEFYLGSDAITNSYSGWLRPASLVQARVGLTEEQRARYLYPGYTIGSAMIWPVRSKDRPTMNQARGTRSKIADRMDLTLECIRRHYAGDNDSPLADVLAAYGDFFALFEGFREFVDFFFFQDLVTDDYGQVRFALPFDDFVSGGVPTSTEDYVRYRESTLSFIDSRQRRMQEWVLQSRSG